MESIAKDLAITPPVLLAILDEILILPKTKKNEDSDSYPNAVNFGLNLINTQTGLCVPHYARCQMEFENTDKISEIFEKVELSQRCRDALD